MSFSNRIVLVLVIISTVFASDIDWKCTDDFCLEYSVNIKCPEVDTSYCYNETLSLIIPSPTECNCCDFCIEYIDKGKPCVMGSPGQVLPNIMCGPGLTCEKSVCKNMTNPGVDELYNNAKYKCSNGICRCQTNGPDGSATVIFGEFEEESINDQPQCGCSQLAYEVQQQTQRFLPVDDIYQPFSRCLPSGQFDPLQCSDRYCSCIDQYTGEYDETIDAVSIMALGPGFPLCYNETMGHTKKYFRDCERILQELFYQKELVEAEGHRFMLPCIPKCKPDGTFADSNDQFRCSQLIY